MIGSELRPIEIVNVNFSLFEKFICVRKIIDNMNVIGMIKSNNKLL